MTEKVPENPSAFPSRPNNMAPGMTLRDWFAGQALAGLMFRADSPSQRQEIARMVYVIADAMLTARQED